MQHNRPASCLLALDAATGPCSVAVLEEGTLRAHLREEGRNMQARLLIPMVEAALAQAGAGYGDVAKVLVTTGPGSFTGVRTGLAAARAIGFARGVRVAGVPTLACIAYASKERDTLALANAGKGEMYAQAYTAAPHFHAASPALILAPGALARWRELGYALTGYGADGAAPDAVQAAQIALHAPHLLTPAEPFYLRPPDAKPMVQGPRAEN
jgi:tRNA threonylcarbamoyladenosine biosynthesis protein TsaB